MPRRHPRTDRRASTFRSCQIERLESRQLMATFANFLSSRALMPSVSAPAVVGPAPYLAPPRSPGADTAPRTLPAPAPERTLPPASATGKVAVVPQLQATFDWEMEPRTGPTFDFDGDGVGGDIPNVRDYVHPRDGYGVEFKGRAWNTPSGTRITSYDWTIENLESGQVHRSNRRDVKLQLPEGRYDVTFRVTNSARDSVEVTEQILVENILVVSMGDSYASGEGIPHDARTNLPFDSITSRFLRGTWADGGSVKSSAQNKYAHRSIYSAPAQAAWLLESQDPHTSVTFVSVAATGATLDHLYRSKHAPESPVTLNPQTGQTTPRPYLPLDIQLNQLRPLLADSSGQQREIDTLYVSAGGNDIGFSDLLAGLLLHDPAYAQAVKRSVVEGVGDFLIDTAVDIVTLDCLFGLFSGCDDVKDLLHDAYDVYLDIQDRFDFDTQFIDQLINVGLVVVDGTFGTTLGYEEYLRSMTGKLRERIAELPGSYAAFAARLNHAANGLSVRPENVFVTGYPDPALTRQGGSPDKVLDDTWASGFEIDRREIEFAKQHALRPLNTTIQNAARRLGWNFVDVQDALAGHGYSEKDNWIVNWEQSVQRQGYDHNLLATKGVMHPSGKGAAAMAERMARAAFGSDLQKASDTRGAVATLETPRIQGVMPGLWGQAWPTQSIRVSFSEYVDRGTLGRDDVTITGPSGEAIEVLSVRSDHFWAYTGGRDQEFTITFRPVDWGTYRLRIGSDVLDLAGNRLDQNRDGRNGLVRGAVDTDAYYSEFRLEGMVAANPYNPSHQGGNNSTPVPAPLDSSLIATLDRRSTLKTTSIRDQVFTLWGSTNDASEWLGVRSSKLRR